MNLKELSYQRCCNYLLFQINSQVIEFEEKNLNWQRYSSVEI
jgi:hypothetical protein